MPKAPATAKPNIGEPVKLRGREPRGTLAAVGERGWCRVAWDEAHPGPKIVHIDELEFSR
jgi:hypothetical protein